MKKILAVTAGVVLTIVLSGVIFLAYLGMFSTLEPVERVMGPYTFVYEEFAGPYRDTGPVFDKVNAALEKEGIQPPRGLGIYYDDPAKVPADKLRSKCGSIIEGENLKKFEKVKEKFKVIVIEKSRGVVVEFPIKNALSYMIGPMKCYPFMAKYIQEKGYKLKGNAYELYDIPGAKTLYVFPLAD